MQSVRDKLRKITNEKTFDSNRWKRLRAKIWLNHITMRKKISLYEVQVKQLGHADTNSGLVYKWHRGEVIPTTHSINRLNKKLGMTDELAYHRMFELLDDQHLTNSKIKKIIGDFRNFDSDIYQWQFPNDQILRLQGRPDTAVTTLDSAGFVARGDVFGFFGILALAREAENDPEGLSHIEHSKNLYRALPSVGKLPWFNKDLEELKHLIDTIRSRKVITAMAFTVDWDVINRQIEDPFHEPKREFRERDPVNGCFKDIEDPIISKL